MRVFITGGTGLIGGRLVERLRERGDTPVVLSRSRESAARKLGADLEVVAGDPTEPGEWQRSLATSDAVVNLAGENIFARRWNDEFKAKIRDSRVLATQNVVAAIAAAERKPAVLVNASAIGYYGARDDEPIDESAAPGDDFLARSCVDWEAAARELESTGTRLVIVRVGVVLSSTGGALAQMLTPFKLGVGGPVAGGSQWMSWIHIDDVVGVMLHAIDHSEIRGVLNGTAPEPVTNRQFSKALGRTLGRPSFFPVPRIMLRLRFGEVANVIATGQRVVPNRTIDSGYRYRYTQVDDALASLLGG